jgi:hypothetical protein
MFTPMFVPPRHSPPVFWFAKTFVPHLGRLFGNVHRVEVEPACLERFREVGPGRALICPNHPTETDPIVVFWLAKMLGQQFRFLATRETLDGPRGWLLNRIGTYSVIRGFPDRESIRATRRMLADEDRKIVIFPEGMVHEHNDLLLEFQSGVAQMGFWALEDLEKSGKEAALPIIPLAIKYRCLEDPLPAIERGLAALERKLHLPPGPTEAYARLVRVGDHVLSGMERAEGIKPSAGASLSARIPVVRQRVLERVAKAAGARLDAKLGPGEQLHQVFNELKSWVGALGDDPSDYDERLYRQRSAVAAPLFAELMRLHNFVAVTGSYVAQDPTAERFLEVLGRLQKEVLGAIPYQAPLGAKVRVAPPIPLHEHLSEYRIAKRERVAEVTRQLQTAIGEELHRLKAHATPIALQCPSPGEASNP